MVDNIEFEEILMTLISNSGDAHACAIEAVRKARAGDFTSADERINEGQKTLQVAHDLHFQMLKKDMKEPNTIEMTLLLTHAQDHLMNAQTTHDLAKEMVEMCREMKGNN